MRGGKNGPDQAKGKGRIYLSIHEMIASMNDNFTGMHKQPTHLPLGEVIDDASNFGGAANSTGDGGSSGENNASDGSNGACSVEDVGRGGDVALLAGVGGREGVIHDVKIE